MPLFSIDLSGEFQSFLIVEALSAAIGIGVMKLHSGRTFVSVLGYRVSRFSDGVFIGKICTVTWSHAVFMATLKTGCSKLTVIHNSSICYHSLDQSQAIKMFCIAAA